MTLTTTRTPRGVVNNVVNWCANPAFQANTTGWSYAWFGTGQSGTNDRATGLTPPPGVTETTAIRKVWTNAYAASPAETGFYYTVPGSLNWTPGTVFYASGWWWANQGQTVTVRAKYYNSSGTLLSTQDGPHMASGYQLWGRLTGGPFTVPAGADPTRTEVWFCTVGGDAATLPAGYTELLTGVSLTVGNDAAVSQPFFDGNTAPSGVYTFGWSGTAGNSASIEYVPDPASIISPLLVLGWEEQQAAGNLFHVLLSGAVVGVQRSGQKRSGTLHLFFGTNRAAAMSARAQHQIAGTWAYQDTDLPETSLTYMVAGPVHLANDDERTHWTLDVPFQEVS